VTATSFYDGLARMSKLEARLHIFVIPNVRHNHVRYAQDLRKPESSGAAAVADLAAALQAVDVALWHC